MSLSHIFLLKIQELVLYKIGQMMYNIYALKKVS